MENTYSAVFGFVNSVFLLWRASSFKFTEYQGWCFKYTTFAHDAALFQFTPRSIDLVQWRTKWLLASPGTWLLGNKTFSTTAKNWGHLLVAWVRQNQGKCITSSRYHKMEKHFFCYNIKHKDFILLTVLLSHNCGYKRSRFKGCCTYWSKRPHCRSNRYWNKIATGQEIDLEYEICRSRPWRFATVAYIW